MNAEFRRNVWLELTTRRLVTMTTVLLLIFFAAALTGSGWPAGIAAYLYYFIVVFWGARNASLSVVGEIRDRTWDFQRLSSVGPADMTWGKLFGSTIFNWYGGAICLVVILVNRFTHQGAIAGTIGLIYFVTIGIIAQSVTLLASLTAAIRRQSHTRLELFTYQALGLAAALAAYIVWAAGDPYTAFLNHRRPTDFIPWWGQSFDAQPFLLASLAIFAAWTLVACYRAMRLELKMRNGPIVWLAFLLFIGLYVAGFDAWLPKNWALGGSDAIALRLALAASTYAIITYLKVFLDPKDRVLYRWLGAEFARGRLASVAANLQGWMMSYLAALAVTAALVLWFVQNHSLPAAAFVVAGFGFLTRDAAIVVLLQSLPGPRRGDFAALVTFFALYVLLPAILNGLSLGGALVFFAPELSTPFWFSPAVAWGEALVIASLALGRIAVVGKPAGAAA